MLEKISSARAEIREALKAVHVLQKEDGWKVMQAGQDIKTFSDRQAAVNAAMRSAALQRLGVLVHESGRATKID
jgi:Uncharacterized protein conserved in bacteria (DUF2188)